jgi:hypothetical protein
MAIVRYASDLYRGLSSDTKPSTNVYEGSVLHELDSLKQFYYYGGQWREATGSATGASGWSGVSGHSGFTPFARIDTLHFLTFGVTGRMVPINLPSNGYYSTGVGRFDVFVDGMLQRRDSASGVWDNDYWTWFSGLSGVRPGSVAFTYPLASGTLIAFRIYDD